jgi:DNA-binding CsgD family transcriptional regulator
MIAAAAPVPVMDMNSTAAAVGPIAQPHPFHRPLPRPGDHRPAVHPGGLRASQRPTTDTEPRTQGGFTVVGAVPESAAEVPRPTLTGREQEVLLMWLRQENKSSAGQTLYITASTVRTHLQRIRRKYAAVGRPASTKLALALRAIQDGLVRVEDL